MATAFDSVKDKFHKEIMNRWVMKRFLQQKNE